MIRVFTLALVLVTSFGCTQPGVVQHYKPDVSMSQTEKWHLMVGKWMGEAITESGDARQWLVQRFEDGTYQIDFVLRKKDGAIVKSSEIGQWAISGPVYFTSFRGWVEGNNFSPSDPSDPYNYDAYQIRKLTDQVFEYEGFNTGEVFRVTRVPSDFQLED